jgi:L-threonylcarbamoyladenylate synthase
MKITPFSDYQTPAGKQEIIECLKKGGVVVFPSDTVYGLLCDASNPEAVSKLLAFKDRPPGKAISIFVTDISMMDEYCEVPPEKRDMLLTMLPGSYTVVLDSKHKLDTRLESETGTLGTRWIAFEPVRELMYTYGKPVTATSANLGGHSPHYSAKSFLNDLPKKKEEYIDIVVDAGELPHNKPSTVIDFTTQELKILRLGDKVAKNTVFHSSLSAQATYDLGHGVIGDLVVDNEDKDRIVLILKGDLGAGKTQFTKGVASYLGIDNITSPTFVVYYEYDIENSGPFKKLYHFDLYNIQSEGEFEHLGIEEILKEKAIICIEWGERLGDHFERFKENAAVELIEIEHVDQNTRKIAIKTL